MLTSQDTRITRDTNDPQGVSIFTALSILLEYPNARQQALLSELHDHLDAHQQDKLAPLFSYLRAQPDLITLQEDYVTTFDRRAAHSLHLFEHIHGESRDRGQAMVDLHEEYQRYGLALDTSELPDYIPLFLEFLAQIPRDDATELLGDAVHVLARIGNKLDEAGSAYACVFNTLCELTPVAPQPLPDPPEGDMEEAMVTFGPGTDGMEPALKSAGLTGGPQPVHFYDSSMLRPSEPTTVSASRKKRSDHDALS